MKRTYEKTDYAAWRNAKESQGRCDLNRLVGKRKPYRTARRWIDHPSMWVKDGKPYTFVSQPYVLNLDDLEEIVQFCRENNLEVFINAERSWYNLGATMLVEVRRREDRP